MQNEHSAIMWRAIQVGVLIAPIIFFIVAVKIIF